MKRMEKNIAQEQNATSSAAEPQPPRVSPLNRRAFLEGAGGLAALSLSSTALGASLPAAPVKAAGPAAVSSRALLRRRADEAYRRRIEAARYQKNLEFPLPQTNGDEERYPNKIATFTKGLLHDYRGEVNLKAYQALHAGLLSGRFADLENVPMGSVKKFANPQAAFAYVLEGPDPHQLPLLPAPAFSSAEQAGEMAELYWMALTRDVPFAEYDTHPLTNAAAADLSRMSDWRGPKTNQRVTTKTLFRGPTPGDLSGPYVSQFLLMDIPNGALQVAQRIRTPLPGIDYLHTFNRWLAVQKGDFAGSYQLDPMPRYWLDPVPRYIRNARDLGEYVHRDLTYIPFVHACLILMGVSSSVDKGHPYRRSRTQTGFCTFGEAHILDLVARVANSALKATWYHKWIVHRRLRPEAFGGRLHLHRNGGAQYPIHPDILNSKALEMNYAKSGSYLLTQAYPEGSPMHPAYPGGHAAIAGACATVLKAYYAESIILRDPVVPSADGLSLQAYEGPPLTVGGELNKLATNIGLGRNMAGIHWRSDDIEGLKLGEAVALGILADMKSCAQEEVGFFSLNKFDGTTVKI